MKYSFKNSTKWVSSLGKLSPNGLSVEIKMHLPSVNY